MRHGNGDFAWWKQEKNDNLTSKCTDFNLNNLPTDDDTFFFFKYVSVFVNNDQQNTILKHWKNKFFESMGGKSHIRCQCNAFPLIPSNKKKNR